MEGHAQIWKTCATVRKITWSRQHFFLGASQAPSHKLNPTKQVEPGDEEGLLKLGEHKPLTCPARCLDNTKRNHYQCFMKQFYVIYCYRLFSVMVRAFSNGPGDRGSIPGWVIPKTQKWYLISPCLTLSIIRYGSRVKRSNSVLLLKRSLRVTLDYDRQLNLLLEGARGLMVIVVGNGHSDTSSNPRRDWLPFT